MHCCIVTCKIPIDMPVMIGKRILRAYIMPVLEEFGYIQPEPDIQKHMNDRVGPVEETKTLCMAFYVTDEEAVKTACIRAEWKPRECTPLDKTERRALRKMSRKRQRTNDNCPICLEECTKPTTVICDHTFCYDCIKHWMGIKRNCPVCDTEISVEKSARRKRVKRPGKSL